MQVSTKACDLHTPLRLFTFVQPIPVEDLERNNGVDKPYFMNKELQKILGVKNKSHDHPDDALVEMQESTDK